MSYSIFDIFKVGIGPSSSHTTGPMRAAKSFCQLLEEKNLLTQTSRVHVELFGSLALTGIGHCSDKAIIYGLLGFRPETIDLDEANEKLSLALKPGELELNGKHKIKFNFKKDFSLRKRKWLTFHPNGMRFTSYDSSSSILWEQEYFSIGGGFIHDGVYELEDKSLDPQQLPYGFKSAEDLLNQCKQHQISIPHLMIKNEEIFYEKDQIISGLRLIWSVMDESVQNGFKNYGVLPGSLKLKRRAPLLYKELKNKNEESIGDPLRILDWVNLYALAVNEENAAGGKVVTAPTNGAAGILPAVIYYYKNFIPGSNERGIFDMLLTAAAIGLLFKRNASISGAEVGCQGEVGVASSMAAGALTQILGGSPEQVENAAEIAMEHCLGLTCDPIGGLVQIPCIERNAMGAIKAINSSRLALQSDGIHFVSLDKVIRTMYRTGKDMKKKYKETSQGGLAVNIPEC